MAGAFPPERKRFYSNTSCLMSTPIARNLPLTTNTSTLKKGAFKNYPEQNATDRYLEDYRVELLKEDSELYSKYLAIVNKEVNDRRDEEIAKAKQLKTDEAEVVDDIDKRILVDKEDAYDVLQDEFEPKGDLMEQLLPRESLRVRLLLNKNGVSVY